MLSDYENLPLSATNAVLYCYSDAMCSEEPQEEPLRYGQYRMVGMQEVRDARPRKGNLCSGAVQSSSIWIGDLENATRVIDIVGENTPSTPSLLYHSRIESTVADLASHARTWCERIQGRIAPVSVEM